jgi:hypothetical protein
VCLIFTFVRYLDFLIFKKVILKVKLKHSYLKLSSYLMC